ncbi:MAG TPA: amidohydrolase family protein [Candidatus Eisenbacteria bacterium]|nr:amidohydrolase family protein [Candidatus Eisenbacteria bacterium]
MKRALTLLVSLAAIVSSHAGAARAAAPPAVPLDPAPIAFVDVSVIPMDRDTVLAHRTVIVRDGRIASIGRAATMRLDARTRRVDGRGKFLMPGLCDMHVHLRYLRERDDNPAMLKLFVANGVTTVLNLLGLPEHLALRDSIARGGVIAPLIYTSGFYVNPPFVSTPFQVDSAVVDQRLAGYDFIKMHGDLDEASYHQLMTSAHREGMRVIGHAPRNLGFETMVDERHDVVAHAEEFIYAYLLFERPAPASRAEFDSMFHYAAGRMKATGMWLMPTLSCYKNISYQIENLDSILARPEMKYVPRGIVAEWQPGRNTYLKAPFSRGNITGQRGSYAALERLTKILQQDGVKLLAGTDTPVSATPPGFSLHDELANLVAAGLTPYQALRMATANAAEFLRGANTFGTVAVGQRADLVLLEADPRKDIRATRRIAGVALRGKWMPAPELKAMLNRIAGITEPASKPAKPAARPKPVKKRR